jgi:hypothetical protein
MARRAKRYKETKTPRLKKIVESEIEKDHEYMKSGSLGTSFGMHLLFKNLLEVYM